MRVSRRTWIACWLLFWLVPSCSQPSDGPTSHDRILQYESDSDVVARFELSGTVVEILPPRTEELSIATRTTSAGSAVSLNLNLDAVPVAETEFESGVRIWLAGQRVKIAGGELWIGSESQGEVSEGPVVIDADGVRTSP